MRRGHGENIRHRLAALGLARNRNPVGRHAHNVGPLERGEPIGFWKPAIVADRHSDPADCRMKHRKAQVARLEVQILLIPEMNLAKCADVAVRRDQHRAVEEFCAGAFADAGDQMQPELRGNLAPGSHGASAGDGFRCGESFLARQEHVSGVGELWQHDQLRAERRRTIDQPDAVGDVDLDLSDRRLHLDTGDLDLRLIACRRAQ